ATDQVDVTADPNTVIANAGPDRVLSCDVTEVTLNALPIGPDYIYQWTGPGINASNEHAQNVTVDVEVTYTLVVTDTMTQCVSAPDTVVITNIAVAIVAIIQDPGSLTCYTTTLNLQSTGSTGGPNIVYAWFDNTGALISTSPGPITISSGGLFILEVRDTLKGCFGDTTIIVEDLAAYPPVDAGPPGAIDCNTSVVTLKDGAQNNQPSIIFQWTGPAGGIIPPDTLLSIDVTIPGAWYYLTATDTVTGCVNADSVFVTDLTAPPLANIDVA